ncbi:MAG: NACHT domain-containing protein [Cyanobacteria bacterium J06627_32]
MLTRSFLIETARKHKLSKKQEEVFVVKFLPSDTSTEPFKSDDEAADSLGYSEKTVSNCMSKVYKKFGLDGYSPGKSYKLFTSLLSQHPQTHKNLSESNVDKQDSFPLDSKRSVQVSPLLQIKEETARRMRKFVNNHLAIKKEGERRKKRKEEDVSQMKFNDKLSLISRDMNIAERILHFFFYAEPIPRDEFILIASSLDQPWIKIADQNFSKVLMEVVPSIRDGMYKDINIRCGTLRVLDVEHSINIDALYVDVNILRKSNRKRNRTISDLPTVYNAQSKRVNRSALNAIDQPRVPGEQAAFYNPKMMIYGKPGSGKTTFLKHIAVRCIEGDFQEHRIPIFVQLRDYVDEVKKDLNYDLNSYIERYILLRQKIEKSVLESLIRYGRFLLLLDGLDEVPIEDAKEVVSQIRGLVEQWSNNRIILTCRIAASEHVFNGFTEVEISDFNITQIESFSRNWFLSSLDTEAGSKISRKFIEQIKKPENSQIKELAVTPILLTLTCLVFQEKGEFPSTRYRLYEDGVDILLRRWDESRGIDRPGSNLYKQLSSEQRIQLLSNIAASTFEVSEYFFHLDKLLSLVYLYLSDCFPAETQRWKGKNDISVTIIRSIEAQHGLLVERAHNIFSFSHLTFQEYFAARKIARESHSEVSIRLIDQITDNRCLEVFLLASEMLGQADYLFEERKKNIDSMIANDHKLQSFLAWLQVKATFDKSRREALALRAFYFDCYLMFWGMQPAAEDTLSAAVSVPISHVFKEKSLRKSFLPSDYSLMKALSLIVKNRLPYQLKDDFLDLLLACLDRATKLTPDEDLKYEIENLIDALPCSADFSPWWQVHQSIWTKNYKQIIYKYRRLGRDWRLLAEQKDWLLRYYEANTGIVRRLDTACAKSPNLREDIRSALLLPIAEENITR